MENKPIKFQEIILWIATTIGFIVDTVALIGLFSALRLGNLTTDQTSIEFLKINIGNISLNWKDITLVIIIYLAFAVLAFIKKTVTDGGDKLIRIKPHLLLLSLFAIDFLLLIVVLWVLIFVFTNTASWLYPYQILAGWLIGTVLSILFLKSYVENATDFNRHLHKIAKRIGTVYIFGIPVLALLIESVYNVSLLSALRMASIFYVLSIFFSIVYGVFTVILSGSIFFLIWSFTFEYKKVVSD